MSNTQNRVLIVDDSPAMLRILAKLLEKENYVVSQAENGVQAIEMIRQDCPDYLITDWEMPYLDGLGLCRALRQLQLPHYLYVLFATGRSDTDDIVQALEAGADDFITKPIQPGELLARMRSGGRVLALERKLFDLAQTDPLTGIPTQRSFHDRFAAEWSRSGRYCLPLTCVMFDIDFFKKINDTLGHPAGDKVIRAVADNLRNNCRTSDVYCRYGGEEFCALLPETTETQAIIWADRLRTVIAGTEIQLDDGQIIHCHASFGVAERMDDTESPAALLDMADQALLVAKRSGRNRVVAFGAVNAGSDIDLPSASGHGAVFAGVTAKDAMATVVAHLHCDRTIAEAAEFFLEHRISSAPVVDDAGRLVGMLSEKDLIGVVLTPDAWRQPIREVMKGNVVSFEEETPVITIYDFLCRVTIRRVVIVKQGYPTGVISRGSLLQWFRNWAHFNLQSTAPEHLSTLERVLDGPDRLAETTSAIVKESMQLHERLSGETSEFLPSLVGGTSRLQDLIADLLVRARKLGHAADRRRAANSTIDNPMLMGAGAAPATHGAPPIEVGMD